MSFDQWKTASPYDDIDDTRCWHCGGQIPEDFDEVQQPWMFDGHCSFACSVSDDNLPCSRAFHEWLLYTFKKGYQQAFDLYFEERDTKVEWKEFDLISINSIFLSWPADNDTLGDWVKAVEDSIEAKE